MTTSLDEILALADVDTKQIRAQARVDEGRVRVKEIKRRLREQAEMQIDSRVVDYVRRIDEQTTGVGQAIDALYDLGNAACSIDPQTCGALQSELGVLRQQLSVVYEAIDAAKRKIAAVAPRKMAP